MDWLDKILNRTPAPVVPLVFNHQRVYQLARHVRTIPDDKWDMEYWTGDDAACAGGHATSIPAFRLAGLRLEERDDDDSGDLIPAFNGNQGFPALAEFFGVTEEISYYWFDRDEYATFPTQTEVADRIVETAATIIAQALVDRIPMDEPTTSFDSEEGALMASGRPLPPI